MAEEGVVQVFRPLDGAPALVGVVGPLQLDVLKVRLAEEYGLEIGFEQPEFQLARWIASAESKKLDEFVQANYSSCAEDLDNDKVFMARNQFVLDYTRERAPGIEFTDIKDVKDKVA
jgi:peptide chain release factor 3